MDTRTINKEQPPVSPLQLLGSHESDLQYILNRRVVGHGKKKRGRLFQSAGENYGTPSEESIPNVVNKSQSFNKRILETTSSATMKKHSEVEGS